jgi:23S rRNA (uracil1939-C5)-methyltransferase
MCPAAQPSRETCRAALAAVPLALENLTLHIDALDNEGRGVARDPKGKVVFVEGALPGEDAEVRIFKQGKKFDVGAASTLANHAPGRREPRCPHFGVCGGCATQHADQATQMAAKQRWLEDCLERIGKVKPERMLPAVHGEEWGYRHRARLSVRRVEKKGGVLVGFRERRSTYIADMRECPVLPPSVSSLIPEMRKLVESLSVRERVPQIEVAVGDNAIALVFRHLLPLTPEDHAFFREFAEQRGVHVWLQPGGPESAHPFVPRESDLYYSVGDLKIHFRPTDFTQVNPAVNRVLVAKAMQLLEAKPGERIADLFCGIGNFSLPIAQLGAQVIGLEGSRELVERARANALANGLVAQFEVADLFRQGLAPFGRFDKVLIDPPREGAIEIVKSFAGDWPRRIVYVSCDPATLARDAGVLVHTQGFRLAAAGVANMFPHTAHVESITLFEREGGI